MCHTKHQDFWGSWKTSRQANRCKTTSKLPTSPLMDCKASCSLSDRGDGDSFSAFPHQVPGSPLPLQPLCLCWQPRISLCWPGTQPALGPWCTRPSCLAPFSCSLLGCWHQGNSQDLGLHGDVWFLKTCSRTSHQDFGLGQWPAAGVEKQITCISGLTLPISSLRFGLRLLNSSHATSTQKISINYGKAKWVWFAEWGQHNSELSWDYWGKETPFQAYSSTICLTKDATSSLEPLLLFLPSPPALYTTLPVTPISTARAAPSQKPRIFSTEIFMPPEPLSGTWGWDPPYGALSPCWASMKPIERYVQCFPDMFLQIEQNYPVLGKWLTMSLATCQKP